MPHQVPADVVKDRFQRLLQLQERLSLEANRSLLGSQVELLVEHSTSKTNPTRMSGRTRGNKLCHFPPAGPVGDGVRPGDLVTVRVEQAAPHHLVGGPVLVHRPRRLAGVACGAAPTPRPLPAGAVPLPLVG
jgi:tRNA-2-methylthio-N6-dimethylallyladenosine synthase